MRIQTAPVRSHVELRSCDSGLELSISDDGVGLHVKQDPRSTGMGQRIVSAMAQKLETKAERDPSHTGTRIVMRLKNAAQPQVKQAAGTA